MANAHDVLAAWPIEGPWTTQPLATGTNNLSYIVTTPGARYILRLYQNTVAPEHIHYEHALLASLQRSGLPFAVPAPLPARSGATLVAIPSHADDQLAALFHFMPGRRPDGSDLAQYRACGAALANLDLALERVTLPSSLTPAPPFGDLAHIHPAVPDPLSMMEHMPLGQAMQARLIRVVTTVAATLPCMYQSLPHQIVHGDFDASNVLMEGRRVTGVLDFEFAGPDLRVIDLARALSPLTTARWSDDETWQRVSAFVDGYRERVAFTPDEVEALPDVMRLYRIVSLIHREGRRRLGLASRAEVQDRVTALLRQDDWLREQGHDVQRMLAPDGLMG